MSFAAAFARHVAERPDSTAVVDDRRRLTFAETDALAAAVAARLHDRGVGRGDVVTSQLPNCAEAYVLCLAVNRLGAVHNPVVPIYRGHEVDFIRGQAHSIVFVDSPGDELFASPSPGTDPSPPLAAAAGDREPRFLLYTSGSTAEPKGVLHSDATLGAECSAQAAYHGLGARDVFVIPSSVGHISGLLYGVLLPMWLGATSVLMGAWDPARFCELVEREGGTFSGGAPQLLQGVLDTATLGAASAEGSRRYDLSTLAVFPVGGADVDPLLISRSLSELGVRTGRGFGSTEFPSITSSAGPDEAEHRRAGTDGRPIGSNEVRIADGEIQARGAEMFVGYRDPALDADAFTDDGWFRTGDLGIVDDGGYLTVTGRLKDVIIRSGENISARELETLLGEHPAVAQVVVVPRPDPRTGERACAVVVPADPAAPPTLDGLCAYLRDAGLSIRKLPEELDVMTALPMTPAGKVDRRALREPSAPGEPPSAETRPGRPTEGSLQ